jgi:hypothetical protein
MLNPHAQEFFLVSKIKSHVTELIVAVLISVGVIMGQTGNCLL